MSRNNLYKYNLQKNNEENKKKVPQSYYPVFHSRFNGNRNCSVIHTPVYSVLSVCGEDSATL